MEKYISKKRIAMAIALLVFIASIRLLSPVAELYSAPSKEE